MRKVTKEVCNAFLKGIAKSSGNSSTDGKHLYLFGNLIAEHREDGLYITNCGYETNTTKERLNALPSVSIQQRKKVWYLNGEEWGGEWIKVTNTNPPEVFEPKKIGKGFDLTKRYVNTDGWRGYEEPIYAVAGANDTGGWSDSPCPSDVAEKELNAAKEALNGIPVKEIVTSTSNVFCVHRYLIVPPAFFDKAKQLLSDFYKAAKSETRLLYLCNND